MSLPSLAGTTPRVPLGIKVGIISGVSLAIAALLWVWLGDDSPLFVTPLSLMTLAVALFLLFLHSQRKVPVDANRVRLGGRILPFEAVTPEGASFHSDSL